MTAVITAAEIAAGVATICLLIFPNIYSEKLWESPAAQLSWSPALRVILKTRSYNGGTWVKILQEEKLENTGSRKTQLK